MKTEKGIIMVTFTILSILALAISSGAQTAEKDGCIGMDGTFHKCGESWTQTYNGVVYDCTCHCPAQGNDCVPRAQAAVSGQGSTGTSSGRSSGLRRQPSAKVNTKTQAQLDAERQEAFEKGKNELLVDLKGGTSLEDLDLKPAGNSQALGLKPYNAPVIDEVANARSEFEKMDPVTMRNEKTLITQRQVEPNPWCQSIIKTLKIKAPPLPDKIFAQLQPGDVLLFAPEDSLTFDAWTGHYIRLFDKLSSWDWNTRASHTCIFLREVKGVKFFLDNLPGEGPRIKTGDQISEEYAGRTIDVAQPVSKVDGNMLWSAARELGIMQISADLKKAGNLFDKTNFGLYGNDNMVCSEASRWTLLKAGLQIADTESPFKKLLGIYYGPANFYSDVQHFLVTPLEKLPKRTDMR